MYEKVLATRLKLQRFLPFIAVSAASAPLLGLLGTVTGIINTFKLITVFGSGDVKTLSGGISEALITTEFGLIVAIPSLLLHAFLSRKARSMVNQMEKAAVAFVNQVSKTPFRKSDAVGVLEALTAEQAQNLLRNIGSQAQPLNREPFRQYSGDSAGGLMSPRVVSVTRSATVAEAIGKIRAAGVDEDIDTVFVVDEQGKYVGHVRIGHLLTRPEQVRVGSLADTKRLFVRVDTHRDEVTNLFNTHDLISMPVLDHNDHLVGRITRNGNGDGK
jgi:Mg/Co/Ni transporter MgtE